MMTPAVPVSSMLASSTTNSAPSESEAGIPPMDVNRTKPMKAPSI